MKKIIKRIIIFLLIIGIAIFTYYKCKIVFAASSEFPGTITFDPSKGDFTAPFESAFTDEQMTYCRKHGKSLKGEWGKIVFSRNRDEDLSIRARLAYALYNNNNSTTRQNIVWYLNEAGVKEIKDATGVEFKTLNTGPETVTEQIRQDTKNILINAAKYEPAASNPEIKIDTSNVQTQNKTIDGQKYCVFSGVKITIGKLGTDGNANLKVLVDGKSIDTYKEEGTKLIKYTASEGRKISKEKIGKTSTIKIIVKASDVKDIKKVKIKIQGSYNQYSGSFAKYTYNEDKSDTKGIQSQVQDMLRLKVDKSTDKIEQEGIIDIIKEPRIITTKYIQSIKRADGTEVKITGEDGLASKNEKLKPTITVHTDKDVDKKGRYDLKPQDLGEDVQVSVGDTITYMIRVYNVGEATAQLADDPNLESEKEQKVGEETGEGTGPVVVKNSRVFDYYDNDHLEFVGDEEVWSKVNVPGGDSYYYAKAKNLTNGGKIKSYVQDHSSLEKWSSWIKIKFRVKDCNKADCKITTIKNNAHKIKKQKDVRLITTKQVETITRKDGTIERIVGDGALSEVEGKEHLKAKCEVHPENPVFANNRYDFTPQNLSKDDSVRVNEGDIITYLIRIYNVGNKSTSIAEEPGLESEKEQKVGEETGKGTGPIVLKDKKVYDYYDKDTLEFIEDDETRGKWIYQKDGENEYYYANARSTSNNGVIRSYGELYKEKGKEPTQDEYSVYIRIKFQVKPTNKLAIVNNSNEIPNSDIRLITTKEVESIDEKSIDLKATCTVDNEKVISASDRYNLTPQVITKEFSEALGLKVGSVITYKIKVYNVGKETAYTATDKDIESDPEKIFNGEMKSILKECKIHDYYDPDTLQFITDDVDNNIWTKKDAQDYYTADASNLTNGGIIKSYTEAYAEKGTVPEQEDYSSYVRIKFRVKNMKKAKISNNSHKIIGDVEPRLVTTKQVKSIKHDGSGAEVLILGEGGLAEETGKEYLAARCTVNPSEDVKSSKRYELKPQDLTKDINVTAGDIITYEIRVYNVGSQTVDFSKEEFRNLSSETEEEIGKRILEYGRVYDYFDTENLEFVDDGSGNWYGSSDSGYYYANATKLTNNGIIKSYEDDANRYSESITIQFKVKGDKKTTTTIVNNSSKVPRNDTRVKYLSTYTNKDKTITHKVDEPKITVDTTKDVADPTRATITAKTKIDDIIIENGDELVYGIRFYSIAQNSTTITVPAIDEFGEGLKFKYAELNGQRYMDVKVTKTSIKIDGLKDITIEGYDGTSEVPYVDLFLTFTIDVSTKKTEDDLKGNKIDYELSGINWIENSMDGQYVRVNNYVIKGRVFIDEKVYTDGKTTIPGDKKLSGGDTPVAGVKVSLYKYKVKGEDPEFDRETMTNENGEYEFTGLVDDSECGCSGLYGCMCDPCRCSYPGYKYIVKFTYNGQEYENVKYNVDNSEGASYAKENVSGNYNTVKYEYGRHSISDVKYENCTIQLDTSDSNRQAFNDKFTTINSENSQNVSLMNENRKNPTYIEEGFGISAYTPVLIDKKTSYRKNVNLGLVKREFDLSIENELISMDVSINGVNQNLQGKGSTIKAGIPHQDVFFKESDYRYEEDGSDKELSVWANYKVTVTNNSKDNFIGILNSIDMYFDSRFDKKIKADGRIIESNLYNDGFNVANITSDYSEGGKKQADNTADNNKIEFIISLHLNRKTIADEIQDPNKTFDYLKTFEVITEISSYSTKYSGDIYDNGNGKGEPNAGKIDEDSNAGNFELSWRKYIDEIRPSTDVDQILGFFNEDDTSRAVGIKLITDTNQRQLTGIVFEDKTTKKTTDKEGNTINDVETRQGDGKYKKDDDKPIKGVTVKLIDENTNNSDDNESIKNQHITYTKKSGDNGEYTITGFIPSEKYTIEFTYGNGETHIYNAQDYKSTIENIDGISEYDYIPINTHGGNAPNGEKYYWYSSDEIKEKGYSIAKDKDMKMDPKDLTYSRAKYLEEYNKKVETKLEDFLNTAKTATIFAPIRWTGNTNTTNEKYEIKNIHLGLAERPRSELQLEKTIDHINVTASDGTTLADADESKKASAKSISWTDRYVQPIIDKNLIYGSTLSVTYKYTITNTGEVDYNNKGFYNYGTKKYTQDIVTINPTLVDYIDNKLEYSSETKIYNQAGKINSSYWEEIKLSKDEKENTEKFDPNGIDGRNYFSTVIKSKTLEELKPGDTKHVAYLTLTRKLPNAELEDQLTYNNYAEILISKNSAGRRNYSIKNTKDGKEQLLSDVSSDENNLRGIININDNTDSKNKDDYILSIPGNIPGSINESVDVVKGVLANEPEKKPWVTLAKYSGSTDIKGNIKDLISGEPDSARAQEIQIIPPFGDQTKHNNAIWIIIITTSIIIIIGTGIYLIKKKVL